MEIWKGLPSALYLSINLLSFFYTYNSYIFFVSIAQNQKRIEKAAVLPYNFTAQLQSKQRVNPLFLVE